MDLGKLDKLQNHRTCMACGAEFETDKDGKALQKFSDHLTIHQPTGEQWTKAHRMIQSGKERAKTG